MQQFRLAVATRTWTLPLVESLRSAVATGATGVQIDVRDELPPTALSETGRRDLLHTLRELGLHVASTVFPLRHPLASEHELDRRLAAIRAAMVFTYQLGANLLCLRAGRLPEDRDSREGRLLHEVLSDLAVHGNHVGVSLALTPTADAAGPLRDWASSITMGHVGVDFDPAHFAQNGQSSTEALRTLYGTVLHVQLRDGVRDLTGGGQETAFGDGAVDWVELLALLGEMDYAGWLTATRHTGDNRPRDVTRAITQVKQLLFM
jgi:sugar phosphate isomerase/epimerase